MDNSKHRKLESIIKNITSEYIQIDIKDKLNIFGIITVLGTKISPDKSYVDIYVSSFKEEDKLTHELAKYVYNLQKKLNKTISMRKSPKIRFRYDESGVNSIKITNIINSL